MQGSHKRCGTGEYFFLKSAQELGRSAIFLLRPVTTLLTGIFTSTTVLGSKLLAGDGFTRVAREAISRYVCAQESLLRSTLTPAGYHGAMGTDFLRRSYI